MRMTTKVISLIVAGVFLSACGSTHVTPTPNADSGRHVAPLVNGTRDACVSPPYAPDSQSTAIGGLALERTADPQAFLLIARSAHTLSDAQSNSLLEALRSSDQSLRSLNFGIYCGDDGNGRADERCFKIVAPLCETNVVRFATALAARIAERPEGTDAGWVVRIELGGLLHARCDARRDPACLPIAYRREDQRDYAPGDRDPVAIAGHDFGTCSNDGDCNVLGCGNDCSAWYAEDGETGATCEAYPALEETPSFCGCVEGRCSWFQQ